jgi:hypothetical protein
VDSIVGEDKAGVTNWAADQGPYKERLEALISVEDTRDNQHDMLSFKIQN